MAAMVGRVDDGSPPPASTQWWVDVPARASLGTLRNPTDIALTCSAVDGKIGLAGLSAETRQLTQVQLQPDDGEGIGGLEIVVGKGIRCL